MTIARLFQVDAFAPGPFEGNSAAVLVLESEPEEEFGPLIGAELNQPATALVWPEGEPGRFGLRWFTAHGELELCGHGTLAAARVILDDGHPVGDRIRFDTRYGPLEAQSAGELIQLRFPILAPAPLADGGLADAVRAVLPVPVTAMLRNDLDVMAVLDSPATVRDLEPDLAALRELPARGLIVTAVRWDSAGEVDIVADDTADFVSRFFQVATGIEDQVTGSAHSALGPYWIARLGRQPLIGRQLSARGGLVRVALDGDDVLLGGEALVVAEGVWRLPVSGKV
ncbi:MAG: PhzF family phenazine biosynthesis protein, partial [Streptosporangiaceae bacterium]